MSLSRCILAVDRPDRASACHLLDATAGFFTWYKIGLQLFLAEGATILAPFKEAGKKIFLDLKLHDIPHTVRSATTALRSLEPDLLTVHASGGHAMVQAAVEGLGDVGKVLAVTVLTSFSEADTERLFTSNAAPLAERWLSEARTAGAYGFVCSPLEVRKLKAIWPAGKAVVPGIRFADSARDDQSRIMTPDKAVAAGADYLVIGRAVTGADDIPAAAQRLTDSLTHPVA